MAKSKGFYGLRKGSTKSMTYSILKGQQITKDRVEGGANPKTYSQMTQRMIFGNAVKFYKHAKAGFFRFAFEDKKTKESDYNAFMRHNANNAVAVTYPNYQDDAYPAFGRYVLTQGSLPVPAVSWASSNALVRLKVNSGHFSSTVGAISASILEEYPGLMPGDIVTIAIVHTSLKADGSLSDERVNRWDIRQFLLNEADERDAEDLFGINNDEGESVAFIGNLGGSSFDTTTAKGCAVIFSRNTPAGLKVSTSAILPNGVAEQFITQMSTEGAIKAAASTWGATDPAILQGALV